MVDFLWVGLGGFLGATARYALGLWAVSRFGAAFPFHTLIINVTGSLAVGVLLVLLTERLLVDPVWRLLLVVGFLGGYTTFSSAVSMSGNEGVVFWRYQGRAGQVTACPARI